MLRFQTRTFQIRPPLNILIVPNWLTVKFLYSLIESTVKLLNTLFQLAHVILFAYHTSIIYLRLTGLLSHSVTLTHTLSLSHTLSLCHSHTHSLSLSVTLTHTLSVTHTLALCHSHTHSHSLCHSHTHTHTHTHTLSMSHTHTHTHTLSLSLSLSLSHTHTLSLSLCHSLTHTLSLCHSLSLSVPVSCYTNPLQSPFHPKLKLLNLNRSILSIKCMTLTLHKTLTVMVVV
jgi:hypothetical protein